jgi:hypothetical protein
MSTYYNIILLQRIIKYFQNSRFSCQKILSRSSFLIIYCLSGYTWIQLFYVLIKFVPRNFILMCTYKTSPYKTSILYTQRILSKTSPEQDVTYNKKSPRKMSSLQCTTSNKTSPWFKLKKCEIVFPSLSCNIATLPQSNCHWNDEKLLQTY